MNIEDFLPTPPSLPLFDKKEWSRLNALFSKKDIKTGLVKYIVDNKIPFPYPEISIVKMTENFRSFLCDSLSDSWIDASDSSLVLEKNPESPYSFRNTGNKVIQLGHQYNPCSNYFHHVERYKCGGYSIPSCVDCWETGNKLASLLSPLWRMNNDELTHGEYQAAFRLGGYIATQFKPHVAKMLYLKYKAETILDTSCGWGDRLAAFYATDNAQEYYGCDPNEKTFENYKKQCIEYERLLGCYDPLIVDRDGLFICTGIKRVCIQNQPAEDMDWDIIPDTIDFSFTSPPYFCTERYNEGNEGEHLQSWSRYSTYEDWRDKFFLPVAERTMSKLKDGGHMLYNIMNPKIKGVTFNASEDLIRHFAGNFVEQIGMRIKQRPRNISKENSDALFSKMYIEPIWCFKKTT